MNRLQTIAATALLAVSTMSHAETLLTQSEMDGVNAGGFAIADAIANALGQVTSAFTNTVTSVVSIGIAPGQFGAIFDIASSALAEAASDSDAKALALATGFGATQGTAISDTVSSANTATNTDAPLPYSTGLSNNTALASSTIAGLRAAARSNAGSVASLSN